MVRVQTQLDLVGEQHQGTEVEVEMAKDRQAPLPDSFTPETAAFLVSDAGNAVLTTLADADLGPANTLSLLTRLRTQLSPVLAGAVLTQARLRRKATAKFPDAQRMFFTAEALEQATSAAVAAVHADWIDRHAPPGPVLDLGCGIGGDLLALAQRRQVVAYETDPVRALFAQVNAATLGLADQVQVITGDWTAALDRGELPVASAAFADPARR